MRRHRCLKIINYLLSRKNPFDVACVFSIKRLRVNEPGSRAVRNSPSAWTKRCERTKQCNNLDNSSTWSGLSVPNPYHYATSAFSLNGDIWSIPRPPFFWGGSQSHTHTHTPISRGTGSTQVLHEVVVRCVGLVQKKRDCRKERGKTQGKQSPEWQSDPVTRKKPRMLWNKHVCCSFPSILPGET